MIGKADISEIFVFSKDYEKIIFMPVRGNGLIPRGFEAPGPLG